MKVYFNFLADGEKPKAMYFLTNTGSFYAESTDSGLIGKDLLYNEYMFHFEGNEDRTHIKLKESEVRISEALRLWLEKYPDPSFVTNNQKSFDILAGIARINLDNYHTVVVGKDEEDLPVIEKTKKLKII